MNLMRNEPYPSPDVVTPAAAVVAFEEGAIQDPEEMYLPH
jgi:hypothetical protein